MRNKSDWSPSKFTPRQGTLRASSDLTQLDVSSRLIADRVALYYDRYLKLYCRGRLIDLGCGKVPLFEAYSPFITECVCVDWPQSMHGKAHVDVLCDLTLELPFESEQFETIVLSDVLEHIPNPEHLWGEMRRILAPGGRILLNTPFLYWLHEVPHDYYRYTEFSLRRMAEDQRLSVLVLDSIGGAPEVVADILGKLAADLPVAGGIVSATIQRLAALFARTRFGKRLSGFTSAAFPLGYFLVAERVGQ